MHTQLASLCGEIATFKLKKVSAARAEPGCRAPC